jgi:hypothetical protein
MEREKTEGPKNMNYSTAIRPQASAKAAPATIASTPPDIVTCPAALDVVVADAPLELPVRVFVPLEPVAFVPVPVTVADAPELDAEDDAYQNITFREIKRQKG